MKYYILFSAVVAISQNCAPTISSSVTTTTVATTTPSESCCYWPFATDFVNTANATAVSCLNASIVYFCVNTASSGNATIVGNVTTTGTTVTNNQLIGNFSSNATITLVCNLATRYYNFILPGSTVINTTLYTSYGCGYDEETTVTG